jgi:hypothetical protein
MGNSRIFDCHLVVEGLFCTMKCVDIDGEVTICLYTYSVEAFIFHLDDDYSDNNNNNNSNSNNNNNVIRNENLPSCTIITFLKYG